MLAYRMGLTGDAAQWAVRKTPQPCFENTLNRIHVLFALCKDGDHFSWKIQERSVTKMAMMHLDAVLNLLSSILELESDFWYTYVPFSGPKIWRFLITRGKNFGDAFFDVF